VAAVTCHAQHIGADGPGCQSLYQAGKVNACPGRTNASSALKKLWAEGHSASQIAKQLGGVTRNAVIGKVHRLGLSGRATPSRPVKRPPRLARPKPRVMPARFGQGAPHRRYRSGPFEAPRTVSERSGTSMALAAAAEPAPVADGEAGHDPDAAGLHVQMADRRPGGPEIRLLRAQGRLRPVLRRARESGLPARNASGTRKRNEDDAYVRRIAG
jgi:GcrA cell cycle regulator